MVIQVTNQIGRFQRELSPRLQQYIYAKMVERPKVATIYQLTEEIGGSPFEILSELKHAGALEQQSKRDRTVGEEMITELERWIALIKS